ncbi:hypothetical protein WBJ53_28325 [Spirosoma sp. SC4-14]|uniref:hypothetical protein n=1 Tax=Spirosoma sp. SC4-14 TaxID=3128900 RepID=UPI0030D23FE2
MKTLHIQLRSKHQLPNLADPTQAGTSVSKKQRATLSFMLSSSLLALIACGIGLGCHWILTQLPVLVDSLTSYERALTRLGYPLL